MSWKLYLLITGVLGALSLLPFEILKLYMAINLDYDARWYYIRLLPLQVATWIAFGGFLLYGLGKLLYEGGRDRRR